MGGINKSMGVRRGVSDLMFSWYKCIGYLELKAPGGKLSDEQREFLDAMHARGHHTAIAIGFDNAVAVLKEWGLPMQEKRRATKEEIGF